MIVALLAAATLLQDLDPQASFVRELFARMEAAEDVDELLGASPWRGEALVFDLLHRSLSADEEELCLGLGQSLAAALARVDRPAAATDLERRLMWSEEELERARTQRDAWLGALEAAGAGRLREAEEFGQSAVLLALDLKTTAVEARARRTLGRVLSDLGACDRARAELAGALGLHRARDARDEVALDLGHLADLEERCGRFEESLSLRVEALEVSGEAGEPVAALELGIGQLASDLGRYEMARTYLERAARSASSSERAEALFALASLESARGQYARGFRHVDAVVDSTRATEDASLRARAEIARAAMLSELGRLREAELALDVASSTLPGEEGGWEHARLDLTRALLRIDQGRPAEALPLLEGLIGQFEAHGLSTGADDARQQRARALAELDRDAAAATAWRDVARRHEASGRRFHAAIALTGLGDAERSLGRADAASAAYSSAIELAESLGSAESGWRARSGLARIRESDADWAGAFDLLRQTVGDIEEIRAHLEVPTLRLRYLEDKLDVYRRAVRAASRTGRLAEAFRWTEAGKARVLLERFGTTPAVGLEEPRARVTLLELAFTRADRDSAPAPQRSALAVELEQARDALEAARIEAELAHPARSVWSGLADPPSLAEVRAALPRDTALVEYVLSEDFAMAWVVTSRGARLVDLPARGARVRADARRMVAAVDALRSREADLANLPFDIDAGRALYVALVEPLAAELREVRRVLLVPDEGLWGLPFTALVVAHEPRPFDPAWAYGHLASCRFWIEDVELAVLPSAHILLAGPRRFESAREAGLVVLVGDPEVAPTDASRLPGARRELAGAREALAPQQVVVLAGADATEARLRERAAGARWLHLASHGEYDAEQPAASRLALGPGGGMDGWLHAFEVEELALDAELVVLSGCETARARAPGEGFLGLPRAFALAGVQDVIATLWVIDDRASGRLVAGLYRELARGHRPASALRRAQLGILSEARTRKNDDLHPFFWSGYVCVGLP